MNPFHTFLILQPESYDALNEPKWLYLFHMTFGHHGWFAMTPILLFALFGVGRLWRSERRIEAILIAFVGVFVFSYYWLRTNNYGGGCGGLRWNVVLLPLWLLAVGAWLDKAIVSRCARGWFVALTVIGIIQVHS